MTPHIEQFERDGFCLLRKALHPEAIADTVSAMASLLNTDDASILKGRTSPAYGARNLLTHWPESVRLLDVPRLRTLLGSLLGPQGGVVRGLYFDKPPGHSWALPWHRDYTIAVKAHCQSELFTKPTVKSGVPHVEAPRTLLESMLTVRVHLDPMRNENGALRVVPGSHRDLEHPSLNDPVTIECDAGDVLLMRPLLLHSSGHSDSATTLHRRIVHLECAASPDLSDGFEWHHFLRI